MLFCTTRAALTSTFISVKRWQKITGPLSVRFQSNSPSPFFPQRQHIVTSTAADSAKLRNEIGFTACVCVCVVVSCNVCMLQRMLQTQMSLLDQYFNKIDITALPFKGRWPRWWLIIHEVGSNSYNEGYIMQDCIWHLHIPSRLLIHTTSCFCWHHTALL